MSTLRYLIPTVCFTLVSLLSFGVWAFGRSLWQGSTTALYSGCAIVFVVLGGIALLPYSKGSFSSIRRDILWVFPVAFIAYSALWCVGWFALKNHHGELLGSALGLLAMTSIFRLCLGWGQGGSHILSPFAVVFLCYTLGYYAGEYGYQAVGKTAGKLCWGAGFGMGLGLGISHLIQLSAAARYPAKCSRHSADQVSN